MGEIEWKWITPDEVIQDIERVVKAQRENKYTFQIGLHDLDFDIDPTRLEMIGMKTPFKSVQEAEQALRVSAILPTKFTEEDETEHQIATFDPRPVGYSGFMNCVTHSLAITNHGLFEIGRYPAISLSERNRNWQWFIHRRLATIEEVYEWCTSHDLNSDQFIDEVYQAMVHG